MAIFRIALANIRFPPSPAESVTLAVDAVRRASIERADLVCFPECYVPGYRGFGKQLSPPDPKFLEAAWSAIAATAKEFNIGVVLGTERVVDSRLRISALVIDRDGRIAGFQDKVQLDPSEDATYAPGVGRCLFRVGALKFGVSICHEGFRYPETFRWAAVRGAQLIVHPHLHMDEGNPDAYRPSSYADSANSFHEKALLCRAAENTCWVATINCASVGSGTTSAVVKPDGSVLAWQPYGTEGLLVADIDTSQATGLLASRFKPT
jgi:predicted amidohydrolase